MLCYRHDERPANAVCKNCGKATCSECSEDTGRGIVCGFSCAEELRESNLLEDRLKQQFGVGNAPPLPASVPAYAMFGGILLVVGIYLSYTRPGIEYLSLALSAAFFVMALLNHRRYRQACNNC